MQAEAVKEAFANLAPLESLDGFWDKRRAGLRRNVAYEPLEKFLGWPSIVGTMFVAQPQWVGPEIETLLHSDPERWRAATGVEYNGFPNTNLIHQAYHLYLWEQVTGLNVAGLESIIEIGGGYGALALVARRAGFTGRYTIYDLPELSLLQQYYLEQMGAVAECSSALPQAAAPDLLVAIYSLSETSPEVIHRYFSRIQPLHHLIGLKHHLWDGQDLNQVMADYFPDSRSLDLPHDGGSYYLMG